MIIISNLLSTRDAIMKEDPDKAKRMRSKSQEGEEESPASPVTDVSWGFGLDVMKTLTSTVITVLFENMTVSQSGFFKRLFLWHFVAPAYDQVRGTARLCHVDGWDAAPVPAGGSQLASLLLGSGHRHHPGRRDGPWQNHPNHRLPLLAI